MLILFAVTTIANLLYSVLRKIYLNKSENSANKFGLFNIGTALVSTLIFAIFSFNAPLSSKTALIAFFYGISCALQYYFSIRALQMGSYAITMLIGSLSTVITSFSGYFFGEQISVWQILGILFMLVFFICLILDIKISKQKSHKWLINCGMYFLTTGIIGVLQKWHQSTPVKTEIIGFLVIAFSTSTLILLMVYFTTEKFLKPKEVAGLAVGKENLQSKGVCKISPLIIIIICVSGVALALNNAINLRLVGKTQSATFFPLINGLAVSFNVFAGFLLFKEKITKKMWIGIIFGILSTVSLCLS